jgi:hypothetical protein
MQSEQQQGETLKSSTKQKKKKKKKKKRIIFRFFKATHSVDFFNKCINGLGETVFTDHISNRINMRQRTVSKKKKKKKNKKVKNNFNNFETFSISFLRCYVAPHKHRHRRVNSTRRAQQRQQRHSSKHKHLQFNHKRDNKNTIVYKIQT